LKAESFDDQQHRALLTLAKTRGKTLSALTQEALRLSRKERLKKDFFEIQGYWSSKAKLKGILTEKDLKRYLER
jgi:hypothetical protein